MPYEYYSKTIAKNDFNLRITYFIEHCIICNINKDYISLFQLFRWQFVCIFLVSFVWWMHCLNSDMKIVFHVIGILIKTDYRSISFRFTLNYKLRIYFKAYFSHSKSKASNKGFIQFEVWKRLTVITVLQYGYAFHASSCISSEPLGARNFTNVGTLLSISVEIKLFNYLLFNTLIVILIKFKTKVNSV